MSSDNDNPSDLCVFDEVGALLARFFSAVKYSVPAVVNPCLEDCVMLCVDCVTWVLVVVRPRWNFGVRKLPSRASAIHAMNSSRSDPIVPLPDDLLVFDQHGAHLAP